MKSRTSAVFSIPNPCNNKWEEMNPVDENKKHCSSCDRVIVDFSKMSDGELLDYFRKNKNVCGQFSSQQLNRKIISEQERKNNSSWKNIFILPSLFLGMETFAQQKPTTTNFNKPIVLSSSENSNGKRTVSDKTNVEVVDSIIVQGIVKDSLTGALISGAMITFRTLSSPFVHCFTDSAGHYEKKINISSQDSLGVDVEQAGYQMQDNQLQISSEKKIYEMNFDLKIMELRFTQIMICGGVTCTAVVDRHPLRSRIRRFFYRIFHPFRY